MNSQNKTSHAIGLFYQCRTRILHSGLSRKYVTLKGESL